MIRLLGFFWNGGASKGNGGYPIFPAYASPNMQMNITVTVTICLALNPLVSSPPAFSLTDDVHEHNGHILMRGGEELRRR